MPIVLIVAEQQPDGNLRKATLNAISAGKQLAEKAGGELHIALVGKDPAKVADELKGFGAAAVHVGAAPELEHYLARLWDAEQIADVDPEGFFDFQATRPHVKLVDGDRKSVVRERVL